MWPAAVSAYALVVHARIAIKITVGAQQQAVGRSPPPRRGMTAMPLNSAAIDQMSALPGSPVRKYISGPPTRRDSLNNVRLGLGLYQTFHAKNWSMPSRHGNLGTFKHQYPHAEET